MTNCGVKIHLPWKLTNNKSNWENAFQVIAGMKADSSKIQTFGRRAFVLSRSVVHCMFTKVKKSIPTENALEEISLTCDNDTK